MYLPYMYISRFMHIDHKCSFCTAEPESVNHLFFDYPICAASWKDLEKKQITELR